MTDWVVEHKGISIAIVVIIAIIGLMYGIRSHNLAKKAEQQALEAQQQAELEAQAAEEAQQQEQPEVVKQEYDQYDNQLGLDGQQNKSDDRIQIVEEEEEEDVKPKQTDPFYVTDFKIWDYYTPPTTSEAGENWYTTAVNISSSYQSSGNADLTREDFRGGEKYLIGANQNPDDTENYSCESVAWLNTHLTELKNKDCVKFTDLKVIYKSKREDNTLLVCTYDWFSVWGIRDTIVILEDYSGRISYDSIKEGDILSAVCYRHNIDSKLMNGYNVITAKYNVFDKKDIEKWQK